MSKGSLESITSIEHANDCIARISDCKTEAEVEVATRKIVEFLDLDYFFFGALYRTGEHKHYHYLVGCDPELCYLYIQNKWYAIDPYIGYVLKNTNPILASEIPLISSDQQNMLAAGADHGIRSSIVIPAYSRSSIRIGFLYIGTRNEFDSAQRSYSKHRYLMRAFALELLEWWDSRLLDSCLSDFDLEELDLQLLQYAQRHSTAAEAALELGITRACVESRYRRLYKKLDVPAQRVAVKKAVELGLIKPLSQQDSPALGKVSHSLSR